MFTLAAYSDTHASVSMLIANAVADAVLTIVAGRVTIPPELPNIVGIYVGGTDVARAQLVAPSLRQFINPEISPLDVNALPASPDRFIDYRFTPIQLAANEQLELDVANAAAGANRMVGGIWLADAAISPSSGDVRSVRVTSATAAVANVWTNAALTIDQVLPAGRYQVVGARFFSTTMQLFRLAFPAYPWRPGGLGMATATLVEPPEQRFGNFGVWGEFNHNAPPTVDVLCTAADATQAGVIDIIKIA